MTAAFETVIEQSMDYFAGSLYPLLFILCLIVIGFHPAARQERDALAVPNVLFAVIIFCPVSAWLIMKMIGDLVYWRTLWMFPIPLVCAYAAVQIIWSFSRTAVRVLAGILAVMLIILCGKPVLSGEYFTARENNLKIPTEAVYVADVISADAKEREIETPKAVVPEHLATYIREYDAGISLAYGRDMAKGDVKRSRLYKVINSEKPKAKWVAALAREEGCDYLVLPEGQVSNRRLIWHSYIPVAQTAGYVIYYDETRA